MQATRTRPRFDAFTLAYLEAMFWTEGSDDGALSDPDLTIYSLAPEAEAGIVADCAAFQAANAEDIDGDDSQAGHDFWLTRNGHGAGFWDGDWPAAAGERLTAACKRFPEVDAYVGDDGLIYLT
jgi:hypothetical protein